MKLNLNDNGEILSIETDKFTVPFISENGFGFGYYYDGNPHRVKAKKTDDGYAASNCFINYRFNYDVKDDYVALNLSVTNNSGYDFNVENVFFDLAVNSYMDKYPDWNDKFFPTMLRLEKTHFYGYFASPKGYELAVASTAPVASYDLSYAHPSTPHLNGGHRIYNTSLKLFNNADAIDRLPSNLKILKAGETYVNTVYLIPLENMECFERKVSKIANVPVISADKYTFEIGEEFKFNVISSKNYSYAITTPSGEVYKNATPPLNEYGVYKTNVTTDDGKIAESLFFLRKDWDFYLYNAAKEAINKPQKASTHTESWYGLFSIFLAQKYFNDEYLFKKGKECFDEIMPLMFDFNSAKPLLIPSRIQNAALFVSLLVDLYQTDKINNLKYLKLASLYGDFLMKNQTDDGAYRNGKVHYTCVIYVAKSMLELVEAEKTCDCEELKIKSEKHYASAKRAVDELVLHLDDIDTEGELTFEDGMISCSALQIALFALTVNENERKKYVDAAEYMIKIHSCLEQQFTPDCRMNGGSLRFWESQYDVMIRTNAFNSPHGWTAWTAYAYYYLYLLTGKEFYLIRLTNTICACAQLLSLDGNLRWAFFSQPYVKAKTLVADVTKPIKDGYKFVDLKTPAYGYKYVEKVFKEEYVDMISGWFRVGNQKVTGGYLFCPLITPNGNVMVDNQGGCCDNDVHEIFKCIEETVFRKAFIHERADGSYLTYGCKIIDGEIILNGNENKIVYKIDGKKSFKLGGKLVAFTSLGVYDV